MGSTAPWRGQLWLFINAVGASGVFEGHQENGDDDDGGDDPGDGVGGGFDARGVGVDFGGGDLGEGGEKWVHGGPREMVNAVNRGDHKVRRGQVKKELLITTAS